LGELLSLSIRPFALVRPGIHPEFLAWLPKLRAALDAIVASAGEIGEKLAA
jgi:hypothetical protein